MFALSQIHIFSGAGRLTCDSDLCAVSICTLHIRIVAMGSSTVPYYRKRQRHIDRCVRIHIDCIISRALLCHRKSAPKTAGKYVTHLAQNWWSARARAHFIHLIDFLKWILNYLYPHALLLVLITWWTTLVLMRNQHNALLMRCVRMLWLPNKLNGIDATQTYSSNERTNETWNKLLYAMHMYGVARNHQTKPLTVITAVLIWILSLLCAAPAAIVSDVVPILLGNTTNRTIYACSPFGADGPYKKTYAK